MIRRPRRAAPRGALFLGLMAAALAGTASVAEAVALSPVLDPARSSLSAGASSAPLSGSVALEVGEMPPPASATAFDVVGLAVSGGGLSIVLDPSLALPGLGILEPDGSFLVPNLFVEVDTGAGVVPLTLIDVAGSFAPSAACGGALCLESVFDVDTLGPQGVVSVAIVAAVPEPGAAVLAALAGLGLAALPRRARKEAIR